MLECTSCYNKFEVRPGYPDLKVCSDCEPDADNMSDVLCPKCGWNSENALGEENAPVKYSEETEDYEYGYCGGCHWTETWTCPHCGTSWEFPNSNV